MPEERNYVKELIRDKFYGKPPAWRVARLGNIEGRFAIWETSDYLAVNGRVFGQTPRHGSDWWCYACREIALTKYSYTVLAAKVLDLLHLDLKKRFIDSFKAEVPKERPIIADRIPYCHNCGH